jgi:four helix bundle protein
LGRKKFDANPINMTYSTLTCKILKTNTMKLEELKMYQLGMAVGEEVWDIVLALNAFAKNTIGYQIVKSADSIAANISESEGVFHFGDRKRFLYYSRGSANETIQMLNGRIRKMPRG